MKLEQSPAPKSFVIQTVNAQGKVTSQVGGTVRVPTEEGYSRPIPMTIEDASALKTSMENEGFKDLRITGEKPSILYEID